jgi:DNA-binding NarL/FixJ family response regulator
VITSHVELALETDPAELSQREHEVLGNLQLGLTNREIAHRLYISTNTVNKHVQQILRKLRVRNRVEAVMRARNVAG